MARAPFEWCFQVRRPPATEAELQKQVMEQQELRELTRQEAWAVGLLEPPSKWPDAAHGGRASGQAGGGPGKSLATPWPSSYHHSRCPPVSIP